MEKDAENGFHREGQRRSMNEHRPTRRLKTLMSDLHCGRKLLRNFYAGLVMLLVLMLHLKRWTEPARIIGCRCHEITYPPYYLVQGDKLLPSKMIPHWL